jgi:hypothetical protein
MRWLAAIALALVSPGCSSNDPTVAIDAAIDAPIDGVAAVCPVCAAGQMCVAAYDGTCRSDIACVNKTIDCPSNACSPACESAYCVSPYQCHDRVGCGGEPAGAFTCYGP